MAAATLWFYLAPDSHDPAATAAFLVGFGIAHVACGYLAGRWWALLLPLVLVVALIPNDSDPEIPAWADYLFFAVVPGAALIGLGVAARRLRGRRATSPVPVGSPTRR